MDDLNVVLGSNGSKMFQKKGKDFEDGFSIIDVAPNKKEINWLESPPKGSSGACSIQWKKKRKGWGKRGREKKKFCAVFGDLGSE